MKGLRLRRMASLVPVLAIGFLIGSAAPGAVAGEVTASDIGAEHEYQALLRKYRAWEESRVLETLDDGPERLEALSFDPTSAEYFATIREALELTDEEVRLFEKKGIVSTDRMQRYSFPAAYYEVYTSDLPVLVTSDSILHAVHQSYDRVLMELETAYVAPTVDRVLADAHDLLVRRHAEKRNDPLRENARDVELYILVARNLLVPSTEPEAEADTLKFSSAFGQDADVRRLLELVASEKMQVPDRSEPTTLYGGERFVDYSQFRPRGHYVYGRSLQNYFRCMMWLGRADTGWHPTKPEPGSGLVCDSDRELRNAALLVSLLRDANGLERLQSIDRLLGLLVGRSDNLTPAGLDELLKAMEAEDPARLADAERLERLRTAIRGRGDAAQRIRSEIIVSDPSDPKTVEIPTLFQLFGQRFVLDSFVLSHQVFDSIVHDGRKQKRMMPSGLDAMAALGNREAASLLGSELRRWHYGPNLLAAREYVASRPAPEWDENLYAIWLAGIRELDDAPGESKHLPEVMRTTAWQRKQLQTQLASWAELRHDTLLYAKPSYTAFPSCEYPAGYVEPYPEFYARFRSFADRASRALSETRLVHPEEGWVKRFEKVREKQLAYFATMAATMTTLEEIARRELAAKPLTDDQTAFLERLIDRRGTVELGSGATARYDGWYCDLIHVPRNVVMNWAPVVADVHTDPQSGQVLQVATGDANLCVVAIDSEDDRAAYVGPVYSYFEFTHPAEKRMTDPEWQQRFYSSTGGGFGPKPTPLPPRPEWIREFQAPPEKRPSIARRKRLEERQKNQR